MKGKQERLAALAAGGELSERRRKRWQAASETDGEVRHLAEQLKRQRESLLLLRDDASIGGDEGRVRALLREQIREERRRGAWRPQWVFAGGIAFATAVLLLVGTLAVWPVAEPPEGPVAAGIHPELPRDWAMKSAQPDIVAAAAASRRGAATLKASGEYSRDFGSPPHAGPNRTPGVGVTEILEQADGSTRLRLQTRNPAVVIYLVEGGSPQVESGGE